MARPRAVSMDTVIYRGEGDTETEIEVQVLGTIEPYFSGSWEEPPSGGGVEDLRAIFYDKKGMGEMLRSIPRDIELTAEEQKEFEDQLADQEMDYEPDYDPPDYYED